MTEDELLRNVIDLCRLLHLHVHHCRPARTERGWRTPIQGHAGFPDVVIAGRGGVLFRELKNDTEKPTDAQVAWLMALGVGSGIWRPADWVSGLVHTEMRRIAARPKAVTP